MSDSHLPQLRQLFEDPRRLEHSEFIVVQTPWIREYKVVRDKERTTDDRGGGGEIIPCCTLCSIQIKCDSQFGGVLGNVIRYFGEFLVGAVDRGALTTALLGTGQVSKAVPS